MQTVDLRSDTLTKPSPEMREVMMTAEVGDDVFGEDPTINRLQEKVAALTGKEAALLVTSGTQGNQIAINAHTNPGQEIIVDKNSHIFNYECGGAAMLSGAQLHALDGQQGVITVEQIAAAYRYSEDHHYPETGLICLENTHNRAGGSVYPMAEIQRISQYAREKGLPLHLDGARLWNACIATGISLSEYCSYFDSVMMCFSKGLGAPVGSIIVGSAKFINRAHYYRKAYGGGMRQGGILAAGALFAIENNWPLLAEDHNRARDFAEAISEFPGLSVDLSTVQTNIVMIDIDPQVMTAAEAISRLAEQGILMISFGPQRIRAVTHLEISNDDIAYSVNIFKNLFRK